MKRFFVRLLVFLCLVGVCDLAVGAIADYLYPRCKVGSRQKHYYICEKGMEDVLIFGSSRGNHHYVPDVLEDTLGMSVYNGCQDGCGIVLAYGLYRQAVERYHPRLVLYEATPGYDIYEGDNNTYLPYLRQFYDKEGVDSIFWKIDPKERVKMLSRSYRVNSQLLTVAVQNFTGGDLYAKGYSPLYGQIDVHHPWPKGKNNHGLDSLKLYYFERFLQECPRQSRLVVLMSPRYDNTDSSSVGDIRELCNRYSVPFISHYTDSTFNFNPDYWVDPSHLNDAGAREYSKVVAREIRAIVNATTLTE